MRKKKRNQDRKHVDVTCPTFQAPMGWLKEVALWNIPHMFVTCEARGRTKGRNGMNPAQTAREQRHEKATQASRRANQTKQDNASKHHTFLQEMRRSVTTTSAKKRFFLAMTLHLGIDDEWENKIKRRKAQKCDACQINACLGKETLLKE